LTDTLQRKLLLLACILLSLILCTLLIIVSEVIGSDRCQQYTSEVRKANFLYWGVNFPYWYAIGQLKQESGCRTDLTAFDGGMGIAQFMPSTERYVEGLMKENVNPFEAKSAIRAQAFYMHLLHKQNWANVLWLTYQAYNGGWVLLRKEYQRATISDWDLMRLECRRKVIALKSGKNLDMCDVNYDYSKKVFKYGQLYKVMNDGIKFW